MKRKYREEDFLRAAEEAGVLDQFSPSYVEMLADENGRIYGLPRDGYVLGMHINLALFREAGLIDENGLPKYPTTLQELAEYGQIIREKTGKAGLVFPASETYGGWLFTNIAWNFGCVGESALEYQDEDGRWVCNFTSPECIAAMEYMRDLRWKYDILNADATTTDWAGAHSLLGTGEAAIDSCVFADARTGQPLEIVEPGQEVVFAAPARFLSRQNAPLIGLAIRDRLGTEIIGMNSCTLQKDLPVGQGEFEYRFSFTIPHIAGFCFLL